MSSRLILPDKPGDLLTALTHMRESAEAAHYVRRVVWWIVFEYLNGNRDFDEINYREGSVRVKKTDTTELDFRYEEIVQDFGERIGELLRMNTLPKVQRRLMTLDHMRKASVSQIVLDSIVSKEQADATKLEFIPMVAQYGMAGLVVWIEPTLPLKPSSEGSTPPEIEVVPPWELMAVPAAPKTLSEVTAIIRQRWVPLAWLKSLGLGEKIEKNRQKVQIKSVQYGQVPSAAAEFSTVAGLGGRVESIGEKKSKDLEEYVKLNEVWVQGRNHALSRYCIWTDDLLLRDKKFDKAENPPTIPIAIAPYSSVGGFYSRGHPEIVLPLNVALEAALGKTLQNVEDLSIHGTTFIPASQGVDPSAFEGSDPPRALSYEPDYTVPNAQAFRLDMADLGQFPVRAIQMGLAVMDRLSPPSPMENKGRVDSARGLGFLQEMSQVPLTFPAMSIAGAYALVYKALLDRMNRLWPARRVAIQTMLDDSLAGVVIDPQTGELTTTNEIPKAHEVEVGIAEAFPTSLEQKRRDLYDMLQGGLITKRWFRIQSRKLNLDLPVANDAEWENYRKAMLNNILLFNDGETPPQKEAGVAKVSESDIVSIHVEVMGAFMARPEFSLASPAVRARFQESYINMQTMLGRYPDQMKYPETLAEEAPPPQPMMGG